MQLFQRNKLFLVVLGILLLVLILLVSCQNKPVVKPSPQPPTAISPSVPSAMTTADATTPHPTDTAAPLSLIPTGTITPSQTSLPTDQLGQSYCVLLTEQYQTPEGFKTYCDADYDFAFDYPQNWEITFIAGSSDSPGSPLQLIRKAQRFSAPNISNFVRADTYRLGSIGLSDKFQTFWGYDEREFPEKDYPSLKIGGHRAYVSINRFVQDISAVYLFFQHGDYYTIMELKAPSPSALDLNWKIAASIQVPGISPQDNVIPEELVKDSHSLTGSE